MSEVFARRDHFCNIGDHGAYYPVEGHADGILASLRNSFGGMDVKKRESDVVGAPIFSETPEQVSSVVGDCVAKTGVLSQ